MRNKHPRYSCSGSKCTNNALVYKPWWTTVYAILNDNVSCYCNDIKLIYAKPVEQGLVCWEYLMTVTWALEVLPLPKFLLPTWTLNSFLQDLSELCTNLCTRLFWVWLFHSTPRIAQDKNCSLSYNLLGKDNKLKVSTKLKIFTRKHHKPTDLTCVESLYPPTEFTFFSCTQEIVSKTNHTLATK